MGSFKQRFHGPVAVCLELSNGPVVYALQKYAYLKLFPVNPATLAKYCQAFTPSQTKDDPTDAELQLELLTQYRDKLKPLRPQGASMRCSTWSNSAEVWSMTEPVSLTG
ncbi:MAG: IS110 family transposase [Acidobacteria bacterium]|nr:IS110 family transposase [Acidobacteriota bacterium]